MRFDDTAHLERWRLHGIWPAIHDALVDLVEQTAPQDGVILDLCSSTGLLGQQLKDRVGLDVVALDANADAIRRGRQHGVNVSTIHMTLAPDSLDGFADFLREMCVTGIVARRCLPELFGITPAGRVRAEPDRAFARAWLDVIHRAGVDNLWIQGRAPSGARARNPLATFTAEAALVSSHYVLIDRHLDHCGRFTRRDTIEPE